MAFLHAAHYGLAAVASLHAAHYCLAAVAFLHAAHHGLAAVAFLNGAEAAVVAKVEEVGFAVLEQLRLWEQKCCPILSGQLLE